MLSGRFALDGRPDAAALTGARASSPRAQVVFDGRLDNRSELAALCGARIPGSDDDTADAAVVLSVFERFGDDFATRLNGDFAVAVLDLERDSLLLARDVMASRSLYYCEVPGAVLFASTIKQLLADPAVAAAPDEDGLAAIVLDNWCDDERTCFRGISSVPAGKLIVRGRHRLERRTHWAFDPERTIRHASFDDYCEEFRHLFAQSVRRRLRSREGVAVSVSGGVDSSSIFCQAAALSTEARHLCGVSLVFPSGSDACETEYVDAIERTAHAPILRVPVERYRFLDQPDAVVRQLECPGISPHTQGELFETARRSGCDVVLSGYFADQMLADRGYLVDLARRGRWLKIRRDLKQFSAWFTDAQEGFFAGDLRRRLVRALPPQALVRLGKRLTAPWRERDVYPPWYSASFRGRATRLREERAGSRRTFSTEHATQFLRHVTAGHYNHAVRCERAIGLMHGVDVRYPFRDRDLVSFLMAIPGEIINWNGVPKGLLRHALAGLVPSSILTRRSKADFSAVENESFRREHRALAGLLSGDSLAARAGLLDAAVLQQAVPPGDTDEAAPGWRLTDAAGLELWMRAFVA